LIKFTTRTTPLVLILLLTSVKYASAQGISAYFGLGSASDSATTSTGCAPQNVFDSFTGFCEAAPTMGGVFGVFGADYMIQPHLGVNGEYAFRFAQAPYLPAAGLNARPAFYDFNAVYQPFPAGKRIVPELLGGIGGARVSLYFSQQICATSTVCTTQSAFFASANHFQLHGGLGVKLYVKPNLFIKPQFDAHWVHNLSQQFGRDFVPQYTVSVGYTFGQH
jgi:Outer membrane protein beta-barrel domain